MAHQRIGQGGTINLDAEYKDGSLVLVDPVNPRVNIYDPNDVLVVSNAIPTRDSTGRYTYQYVVSGTAPLGTWVIRWTGTINSVAISDDDFFEVVKAGDIIFTPPTFGSICQPWASVADLCAPCNAYEISMDPVLLGQSLQMASDILYQLSGRRWTGACSDVVRPNARYTKSYDLVTGWMGFLGGYGWFNGISWNGYCTCNAERRTGCNFVNEITLGGYPLIDVLQVKVDGAILDPSLYRIDDHKWLVRLPDPDGSKVGWPCCQQMDLPTTEKDTFEVTFIHGTPPPVGGVRAAAALGCELALWFDPQGREKCRLPRRVTSILRQGVNMVVLDPFDFLDNGKTGIYEVDLWLKAVNPGGLRGRAQAISVDQMSRVRRAGT